jgi:deoxyribonuclease IV
LKIIERKLMSIKKTFLLGAHMSTEGGREKALERGASIGCTVIQIFTKSNRQWLDKSITKEEGILFKKTQKECEVKYVIAHASYLINLGSPKPDVKSKSIMALTKELNRCHTLGIPYLVLHPGSRLTSSADDCIKQIAAGIDIALEDSKGTTMVLLETMAGQGTGVGSTFEEIAHIRHLIKHKARVGVCLDTCHVFAAGYKFSTKTTYEQMWDAFNKIIGLEHLKAIHVNDSKKECGSKVDRHEEIGKGKIGLEAFKLLFNDPRLFSIPKILETPKSCLADDAQNMKIIRGLLSPVTKKTLIIENGREEKS